MGTINFHYWRSQKKKMAIYLQAIFGNFSWCFLFFCVFFFACVILSLYHRSFLLLAMKHLKQLTKPFGLWHCEVYVKKRGPTSTLWPGQHLIFCAFASLQGLEILLKHCRSNLMLHCQIPSDAVMSFKQKLFSLYLNLNHILLIDKLQDVKSIYSKINKLQLSTSLLSHEFTSVSVFLRHKKPNAPHLEVHQCCTSTVHG